MDRILVAVDDRHVVVAGESGVGKTALVAAVGLELARRGRPVASIIATVTGRSLPYAALGALLPDTDEPLHPGLVTAMLARRLDGPHGSDPPVLIVDDAHLLDDPSAVAVLGLVTRGAARVVLTVHSGAGAPGAVTAIWKDGPAEPIDLHPLDRAEAAELLAGLLGGPVARSTAELFWRSTHGNPLHVSELVHYGRSHQQLDDSTGVWYWRGAAAAPPRLAVLLEHRFDGISMQAAAALDIVAVGEPLTLDDLVELAGAAAVTELEDHRLIAIDRDVVTTVVRFAHQLLAAAWTRRLGSTRRREIARSLLDADLTTDPVLRASWILEAGAADEASATALRAGARASLLGDPTAALRMAEAAAHGDPSPESLLLVADALAELGRAADSRRAVAQAAARAHSTNDQVLVALSDAALSTWSERDPRRAFEALRAAQRRLDASGGGDITSAMALIALFGGHPRVALRLADACLAAGPVPAAAARAGVVRAAALAVCDRVTEAATAAEQLLRELPGAGATPYTIGMAHALSTYVSMCQWTEHEPAIRAVPGRWPVPSPDDEPATASKVSWPLLEGVRTHLQGRLDVAIPWLREAVAIQRSGEGQFRSEATAGLIVALSEAGRVDEAADLLATEPPDDVALTPDLEPWARAAVVAGRGHVGQAAELALGAARRAASVGAVTASIWCLEDAARYGRAAEAAAVLDGLRSAIGSPLSRLRAAAIDAWAAGDAEALLAAAQFNAHHSLWGRARELAVASLTAPRADSAPGRAKAVALVEQLDERLGVASMTLDVTPLTRREAEVARLAARAMTDRQIAAELFVSARTVQSHLASVYRKLGIASRGDLRTAWRQSGLQ